MDQLFISAVELEAIIGVYPEERLSPQPIVLDIEMTLDTNKAGTTDDIADTLDYDVLVKKLQNWMLEKQFHLIEALANHLAEKILKAFSQIQNVCLRLHKFPQGLPVAKVGVVVMRGRDVA